MRAYLKTGVATVMRDAGPDREPLAKLAAAIAEVGKPEDMADLETLLRADIERRHDSSAYSNYYIPAIMQLEPEHGEKVLIDLLREPEYFHVLAQEMSRPFLPKAAGAFDRGMQYDRMWSAREGKSPPPTDNDRRLRDVAGLRDEIAAGVLHSRHRSGSGRAER